MASLIVLYPASGTRFDREYYREHHARLVHEAWDSAGMTALDFVYGEAALGDGPVPFHLVATLTFTDRAALDAAVGGSAAAGVFGDIANFTDATPVAMIGTAGA